MLCLVYESARDSLRLDCLMLTSGLDGAETDIDIDDLRAWRERLTHKTSSSRLRCSPAVCANGTNRDTPLFSQATARTTPIMIQRSKGENWHQAKSIQTELAHQLKGSLAGWLAPSRLH